MAVSLKHNYTVTGTDAGNGEVGKDEWNDEHVLSLGTGKLIGRTTAGTGPAEEITVGTGLSLSGGTLTNAVTATAPGGSDAQVQFNDGGAFGGSANFTFNKITKRLDVGEAAGALLFEPYAVTGGMAAYAQISNWNTSGYGDGYYVAYARGTPASPAAVQNGDNLGIFGVSGYDGSNYLYTSQVTFPVDGSVSANSIPTAVAIVTGDTNNALTERLRVSSSGVISIAGGSTLAFKGSSSGTVTIQPAAAAGTYTLTLPTDDGNSGQVLTTNGSGVLSWTNKPDVSAIGYTIDGGGAVITTGIAGMGLVVPYACTIVDWTLLADVSGAIKIDVWKDTYANFPPTNTDSMTNGNEPEIAASGVKAQDTDLSNWTTTSVAAGDILYFNVDSCSTITKALLVFKVVKT